MIDCLMTSQLGGGSKFGKRAKDNFNDIFLVNYFAIGIAKFDNPQTSTLANYMGCFRSKTATMVRVQHLLALVVGLTVTTIVTAHPADQHVLSYSHDGNAKTVYEVRDE